MKMNRMKRFITCSLFYYLQYVLWANTVYAQIEKIWETNHTVGADSLEVFFYKQDSSGNHYTGGAIASVFFVSKYSSSGMLQWTTSSNELVFEPEYGSSVQYSWVSDMQVFNSELYLSGTKFYLNGQALNFILKLNLHGDSIGFKTVRKPILWNSQVSINSHGGGPFNRWSKPKIRILEGQLYLFTSMWPSGTFGSSDRINLFKYDESLNLLKNDSFETPGGAWDLISNVLLNGTTFYITSLNSYYPRILACDSSLNLLWDRIHKHTNTSNHAVLNSILADTVIYCFSTLKDTSKKAPAPLFYRPAIYARSYDLNGNMLDSVVFGQSPTSSDSVSGAVIGDDGMIYLAGISKDSNLQKGLIVKLTADLEIMGSLLFGQKALRKVDILSQGCRKYTLYTDSVGLGSELNLLRLDDSLRVLSNSVLQDGKPQLGTFGLVQENLFLVSIGKNSISDTLKIKFFKDTTFISELVSFTATPLSPRSIELNWQLSAGLTDSVFIYKSIDNDNWELLKSLPFSALTVTDSNLYPSTRYYYSILAKWQVEYSCNQLFASDSTPFNTGIMPIEQDYFTIYPNPAYSEIQIKGIEEIDEVELFTSTGVIIRHYSSQETIPVKDLVPGIYLIRINKSHTYKVLKL